MRDFDILDCELAAHQEAKSKAMTPPKKGGK